MSGQFLSTPSARRATLAAVHRRVRRLISIHALREEGDPAAVQGENRTKIFLSTPSARRATQGTVDIAQATPISIHALREEGDNLAELQNIMMRAISIHALREEGDSQNHNNTWSKSISIHALREEGDNRNRRKAGALRRFLSTPSARRATHPA